MRAPFSRLSFWPSLRCLCLFWLSLKHGLTIADVLPAPHPFILPIPEPFESDWTGAGTRCQLPLCQAILGYLTLERNSVIKSCPRLKKNMRPLVSSITFSSCHVFDTERTRSTWQQLHEILFSTPTPTHPPTPLLQRLKFIVLVLKKVGSHWLFFLQCIIKFCQSEGN